MEDAEVADTELLLDEPKRFVHQRLLMPDDVKLDWYYVDTPPSVMVVPVSLTGNWSWSPVPPQSGEVHARVPRPGRSPKGNARHGRAARAGGGDRVRPRRGCRNCGPSARSTRCRPRPTSSPTYSSPAPWPRPGRRPKDTEIERYFNMSVVIMPPGLVLESVGDTVAGTETITALMLAREALAAA